MPTVVFVNEGRAGTFAAGTTLLAAALEGVGQEDEAIRTLELTLEENPGKIYRGTLARTSTALDPS